MKRVVWLLLGVSLVLFAAPVFAGGAGEKGTAATTTGTTAPFTFEATPGAASKIPPFDPNKKYNLTFGTFEQLGAAYQWIIDSPAFKKAYPNITVSIHNLDWDGDHTRLQTAIAAGTGAYDIEVIDEGWISEFASGGFTDLSQQPFNGRVVGQNQARYALANVMLPKGEMIAMPVDLSPGVMFYNDAIAKKAGVDFSAIKTWQDYVAVGQKLVAFKDAKGKQQYYLLANLADFALLPLNNGIGGWFDDKGNPLQPKEKYLAILNDVRRFIDLHLSLAYQATDPVYAAAFNAGQIATSLNGSWFSGNLKDQLATGQSGQWRVALLPGDTSVNFGGSDIGIPEQTPDERKAAAFEVLKYICTNAEAQLHNTNAIGSFPANMKVWEDPSMSAGDPYFGGQKVKLVIADAARKIPAVHPTPADSTIRDAWNAAVNSLSAGTLTSEQAYTQVLNTYNATR